jgi:hypothetical protein
MAWNIALAIAAATPTGRSPNAFDSERVDHVVMDVHELASRARSVGVNGG